MIYIDGDEVEWNEDCDAGLKCNEDKPCEYQPWCLDSKSDISDLAYIIDELEVVKMKDWLDSEGELISIDLWDLDCPHKETRKQNCANCIYIEECDDSATEGNLNIDLSIFIDYLEIIK